MSAIQQANTQEPRLYILMISVHGLLRGHDMELGRDADTGGQITYVVELAKALGRNPDVGQIDLLTRLIDDPQVSPDYAQPEERLADNVRILRLPEIEQRLIAQAADPVASGPDAFARHIAAETRKWAKLIKQAGIKPD